MNTDRATAIEQSLTDAFSPQEILVKDQSHLHEGHAGSRDGKGHFEVRIVADAFAGQSRIQRHRMVFDAVGKLMDTDIHALRIKALTPEEYKTS
jgi:BolA protein